MTFTDQIQRTITLPQWPPQRIISLVPSQTELLADLELDREVLGITKFCIHPNEWFRGKTRVGGTKTLNLEKIASFKPDLIIGNKEENDQDQIEWLGERFPVWMSDVYTLEDALWMIRELGSLCDRKVQADKIVIEISQRFQRLARSTDSERINAAYLIWRKPFMAAGADTFIHDMLYRAGFRNVFGEQKRYPELKPTELAEVKPDVILLSSEPYPFAVKHIAELQTICPSSRVLLVDGELFSWYGSRLIKSPGYFSELYSQLK
ncbi:MAG: helical backbone metal receptor [Saprospiraceae bacterium]|nr:ABC transporter substrate-binding protein [Saprospiraceae bacterium]